MKYVILAGATGHTGNAVAKAIDVHPELELVAGVGERSVGRDLGEILSGKPDGRSIYANIAEALDYHSADVLVDFTSPEAAQKNLSDAVTNGLGVIVGTTGIDKNYLDDLAVRLSQENLFGLIASNFSLGIVALAQFSEKLSTLFDTDTLQIIETHNVSKKDTPSGTAAYLQQLLSKPTNNPVAIESRRISSRTSQHEIHVNLENETLVIKHEVSNPGTFGDGVVFVLTHYEGKPGVYRDLSSFVTEIGQ